MIDDLAIQQRSEDCLKILAIDAGNDINMNRDEWMAINMLGQTDETPILALLGGLHALKKINWVLPITKGSPSVAEILSKHVNSYPQVGLSTECNKSLHNRLIPADTPEALELLNNSIFSLLNAFEPDSAVGVVDGIIVWECSV